MSKFIKIKNLGYISAKECTTPLWPVGIPVLQKTKTKPAKIQAKPKKPKALKFR